MSEILIDTGPLVAVICAGDRDHAWTVERFRALHPPFLTCEAVIAEAFKSFSTVREGMNVPISIWGANQGKSASLTIDPGNFPTEFGAPGSVCGISGEPGSGSSGGAGSGSPGFGRGSGDGSGVVGVSGGCAGSGVAG